MSGGNVTKKRRIGVDYVVDPTTSEELNMKLLKKQRDCDLFFVVGPEKTKIGAHSLILNVRSSYFEAMLTRTRAIDNDSNEIILEDAEISIVRSFLEHIYTYAFNAGPVKAVKLLYMTYNYGVSSLAKSCEKVLAEPFQPDDFLEIFILARKYSLTQIMQKAGESMANYFTQLANSPTFEQADEATLIFLLERDDLNVEESKLFAALLRWAGKQIENSVADPKPGWGDVLKNLIPLVRFPIMEAKYFAEVVAPMDILPPTTKCSLFMYLNSDEEKREEVARDFIFNTIPRKNALISIDFYKEASNPGSAAYPHVALEKSSNILDVLTFRCCSKSAKEMRIISLVLEPPKYSDGLFQNNADVAEMNLPIKLALSLSETSTEYSQPTWTSEELDIGNGPMVLTLDKPWTLSPDKSYRFTVHFLSNVFTVPGTFGATDQNSMSWRDDNFDYFTSSALRTQICLHGGQSCWIHSSSMMRETGLKASVFSVQDNGSILKGLESSGLHLLRSIQVVAA